jgi:uncharacterized phage protein gp47/JayE
MAIDIRSYNQILGEMVRKIIADTPLNDLNTGSVLLSLLEAAAQVDFENNASILSVLELLNIDATRNNDLDQRGADFGLVRTPAQRSTGFVSIQDTSISKRSTGLYQVKTPPIASSTTIYVNNASEWNGVGLGPGTWGDLFIGRGTSSFEGPIPYTEIVDNGSFYTITLGSALQKDHLISDVVVDGQGTTDRLITAGTSVFIPANNQNPSVEFRTLRDAVIPAGEDIVSNVSIVSVLAGSRNNAGINTITNFTSTPFTGAKVFNTSSLSDGRDVETDDAFRERIKSYSNTLARGTVSAIISAIIGVSDSDDGKQVASASITEPPVIGDPSILYIDDGSGFQPSFNGQSVDILLSEASGNEEFLQLANYPLPRPQVINTIDGPYELTDGMSLRVIVDGVEESVTFSASQFLNISAATASEVIVAINNAEKTFKATFTDTSSKILLFSKNHDTEIIQVSPLRATDDPLLFANSILKFPNNEYSYIRLYQNNTLLNEKQKSASLLTTIFPSWNITGAGNLVISVDGTPPQDRSFSTADFGGIPFASLTLNDWVAAFNAKYAGITATATSSDRIQIVSNKDGSASTLVIEGGDYFDKLFSNQETSAVGQNSDFQLNRQTGNLRILTDITVGDTITAGTDDAKGNFISSETITGNYNVSTDANSRPAELVITADAKEVSPRFGIGIAVGDTLTITNQGGNVMRIMSDSLSSFDAAQPHDFIYITSRGVGAWIDPANTGLYRIVAKGEHTTANTNSYIEVKNVTIVPGTHVVQASEDIQVFKSDKYPQLWKGSFTAIPASAAIQNIIDTINNNLVNVKASVFKTDSIKLTSSTEEEGSIALPVSVGNSALLFASQQSEKAGNPSHIANRVSSKDAISFFKITEPTAEDADNVNGKSVWLDRVTYADSSGTLTSNAIPGTDGVDPYSEELQSTDSLDPLVVDYDDIVNNLDGNNKGQYRSIRDKLAGDKVGTQHALPRTLMDYSTNDRFNLMRPVSINAEDSIVLILDQDAVAKTIDIKMSRTGRVNTSLPISNQSFSANDADNEPNITFSNLQVWGKTANKTEFKDYAIWFRSRNWYVSGGATSGGGAMLLRAREYGPHGNNYRFRIEYPALPNQTNTISHDTTPDYSLSTYAFGSGPVKATGILAGDTISVSRKSTISIVSGILSEAAITDDDFFTLNDSAGVVAVVYDKTPYGVGTPASYGANRIIVVQLNPGDAAAVVAGKTAIAIAADSKFDATYISTTVTITNSENGALPIAADGANPTAFTFAGTVGEALSQGTLRYTFSNPATDLSTVVVGDVISMLPDSGISALNRGTFRIKAVDNILKHIDIYNPYGTETGVGAAEVSQILTVGDVAGTKTISTISAVTAEPSITDDDFFTLNDSAGVVAVVYNKSGGVGTPASYGANRILVVSLAGGESANDVAALTSGVISADPEFDSTYLLTTITVTNVDNGAIPQAADATGIYAAQATGFNFAVFTLGTAVNSLNGKYFTIHDANGSVAFWYDVTGVTPEPLHGATRAVRISTILAGDSANTVATKTAVVVNGDAGFASATAVANAVTITDAAVGGRVDISAGTSGFAPGVLTNGSNAGPETVAYATSIMVFPLINTAVTDIVAKINADSNVLYAALVSGTNPIVKATRDEEYTPAGLNNYSVSLSYGHDPNPVNLINGYVGLYDGINWVRQFENTLPNFSLKTPMTLQGVAPTAYAIESAPNHDSADLGEFFKLVPITLNNIYHHLTQKALSQLPIVSDIAISNAIRKIQVKSKQLGSAGSVEVVGGNANNIELSIFGEGQISPGATKDLLEVKTAAFPVTITKGDYVEIANTQPTKRASKLKAGDSIDVFKDVGSNTEYRWNHKDTQFGQHVRFTIADQSTAYGRPAGTVWRWTHNDGGSYFNIVAKANGAVPMIGQPEKYDSAGIVLATRLHVDSILLGSFSSTPYIFTTTSANATIGATYTNNGNTFTVVSTISGSTTLTATGTGNPDISGTLTKTAGTGDATITFTAVAGSPESFNLTVSSLPSQGDYFTFQTAAATPVTFAVWFDVDGVGTPPIGASYISATNKIEVDITSIMTEDQIISALAIKLLATPAFLTHFTGTQTQGANLDDVEVGDLLCAYNTFPITWSSGNKSKATGDTSISGLPIINVNAVSRYMDIVNPDGVAMTNQAIGTGSVNVAPTPSIKWNLKHSAKTPLVKISVLTGTATATTTVQHGLKEGDTFTVTNNAVIPTTFLVISVPSTLSFTFATATGDGDYFDGHVIRSNRVVTRYAIESIGFNNLYKLRHVDGDVPGFIDCGVAVDDILSISGDTFSSSNSGTFRVLGVTNDSMIYQNDIAVEQLDTLVSFNNLNIPVSWTANLDQITGTSGAFENLSIGDWVKKKEDPETFYRQVIAKNTGSFDTATMITLGGNYQGTSSSSIGVSFDQNSDVGKGVQLQGVDDIQIFEGDSVKIDDKLFVDNIANTNWFSSVNAGLFKVIQVGSTADCRPFVRISNASGATQSARQISVSPIGFYLIEGEANTYRSLRRVEHTVIDVFNENRRQTFLTPATRAYKVSQTSGSQIIPIGKLNYSVDVTTGIDGYSYYTGLMRTVQRIVDGFEPDSITYPGRRAIGGVVEILPPLIKRVNMALQVTTNEGVNLNDVTNDIKSAIISYINQLGVSGDVILAEVIVRTMGITGVEAVTVNSSLATTEGRIPVSDNERAFVEPGDISIA